MASLKRAREEPSARVARTKELTGTDLSAVKVLVVGAGGIGCELVKNLVLTGIEDITMVDLDTIDYSNLNRQFLFRAKHVGRSKAEVARESVLEFPHSEKLKIEAAHGNIKSPQFTFDFFRTFDIVLNGLDNVDARRYVNRLCLASGVPLIESGTEGYLGQARAIIRGRFKCYECDPPRKTESYPICTIRNHPDKPVHCIAWAKELLFKKLFGNEETDLVDESETAEGAAGGEASGEAADGAPAAAAAALEIQEGETPAAFARRVFRAVFEEDVQRLLSMDSLWKERAKPVVLRLQDMTLPDAASLAEVERRTWSLEENAAVFLCAIESMHTHRAAEFDKDSGGLEFDKDDPQALDFVTSASNLRSEVFHIARKSRWEVKEIAGKIVPAIATTNAIIGGFIVLEALKVLRGETDRCRYMACNYHELTGRKRDRLLAPDSLDPPNPKCGVCLPSLCLVVDTATFTVGDLIDAVVTKRLGFSRPTIYSETLAVDEDGRFRGDQICEGLDPEDDEEEAKYARYRGMALSALPVPVGSGSKLDVEDTEQEVSLKIDVVHSVLDATQAPQGFLLSGDQAAAIAAAQAAKPVAEEEEEESTSAAPAAGGGASSNQPQDVEDGVMVLD